MSRITLAALICSVALPAFARDITGTVAYREKIALDPSAELVVELRGPGGLVAEARVGSDGKQVPLPFVLSTDDASELSLLAAVFVGGLPVWVSEPVTVPGGETAVDLGTVALQRHVAMGFSSTMRCGDIAVEVGFVGDLARLKVGSEVFELKPLEAASGARFSDGAEAETVFWTQGNRAMVTVKGVDLAECLPVPTPSLLPFTARGNEPGWIVTASSAGMMLSTQDGETVSVALPAAETEGDGIRFAAPEMTVSLTPTICRDTMTGMPFPLSATVTKGDITLTGCAGEPARLLDGDWAVTTVGETTVPDTTEVTMTFSNGSVSGNGGCNRYNSGFTLSGEGLAIMQGMSTMMACEEDKMALDGAFHAALSTVTRFDIDESGNLVLLAGDSPVVIARR